LEPLTVGPRCVAGPQPSPHSGDQPRLVHYRAGFFCVLAPGKLLHQSDPTTDQPLPRPANDRCGSWSCQSRQWPPEPIGGACPECPKTDMPSLPTPSSWRVPSWQPRTSRRSRSRRHRSRNWRCRHLASDRGSCRSRPRASDTRGMRLLPGSVCASGRVRPQWRPRRSVFRHDPAMLESGARVQPQSLEAVHSRLRAAQAILERSHCAHQAPWPQNSTVADLVF